MLHGNPQACANALERAGLTWDDIAVIEVNEAFASVVLQFIARHGPRRPRRGRQPERRRDLARPPARRDRRADDRDAPRELERRDARYGIAYMCIGFGQAIAGIVERV